MFNRAKARIHAAQKPDEERAIEDDARKAIGESREQISRARSILEKEVRRLDQILARGK